MNGRPAAVALAVSLFCPALAAQCELGAFDSSDFGPGSEPADKDRFGRSVAVDGGGVVAVGAPFNDEAGVPSVGAVYVYRHDGAAFQPEQKLQPGPSSSGGFGTAVFLDGDVLLASGGVGLTEYTFDGSVWSETALLPIAVPGTADFEGDVVVVGSAFEQDSAGEARVYRRGPAGWTLEQLLPNPLAGVTDRFGIAVSVSGDVIAVGASGKGSGFGASQGLGVVHLYRHGVTGWIHEDVVSASDGELDDLYAVSVAVSGDALAVGATHTEEVFPATGTQVSNNGAVYVYRHDGQGGWPEEQMLVSEGMGSQINFGRALDLDGDVLVASSRRPAPFAGSGDVTVFHRHAGAAYVFDVHPAIDLGSGLAGTGGLVPRLELGGLCAAADFTVSLSDAKPSSTAWLAFGLSSVGLPVQGGILVPSPDVVVPVPLSAAGTAAPAFPWPPGLAGLVTWWQFAVPDDQAPQGWAFSNALTRTAAGL